MGCFFSRNTVLNLHIVLVYKKILLIFFLFQWSFSFPFYFPLNFSFTSHSPLPPLLFLSHPSIFFTVILLPFPSPFLICLFLLLPFPSSYSCSSCQSYPTFIPPIASLLSLLFLTLSLLSLPPPIPPSTSQDFVIKLTRWRLYLLKHYCFCLLKITSWNLCNYWIVSNKNLSRQ